MIKHQCFPDSMLGNPNIQNPTPLLRRHTDLPSMLKTLPSLKLTMLIQPKHTRWARINSLIWQMRNSLQLTSPSSQQLTLSCQISPLKTKYLFWETLQIGEEQHQWKIRVLADLAGPSQLQQQSKDSIRLPRIHQSIYHPNNYWIVKPHIRKDVMVDTLIKQLLMQLRVELLQKGPILMLEPDKLVKLLEVEQKSQVLQRLEQQQLSSNKLLRLIQFLFVLTLPIGLNTQVEHSVTVQQILIMQSLE